ncbi:hypothetical protein [Oceanobacillus chungangensis]|uniref:Uncharacterized protein n=1 Tax=Oceanobacillus chungangensis TaxID=1229152 RepID=A0A3D8PG48_9BACI|nr:hypothetical protein [Oceanobacillus chungangensis]RDW15060.1 hypothetical protein CWR45_18755 [Oceanobacillus chungangensis]
MKRYLTIIYIVLSGICVLAGLMLDKVWSGIVGWALAVILLIFALNYTKYIPEETEEKRQR